MCDLGMEITLWQAVARKAHQLRKTWRYARGYDASRKTAFKILWRRLWK